MVHYTTLLAVGNIKMGVVRVGIRTERILFNGAPSTFYDVTRAFARECETAGREVSIILASPLKLVSGTRVESLLSPDSSRAVVNLRDPSIRDQTADTLLEIEAIASPDKKTRLIARAEQEKFDNLEWIWVALVDFLDSQGWTGVDTQTPKNDKPGRKSLACNVWLEHMVNVKNCKIGSYSEGNELFQMWKKLYLFETGKDPDNPDDVADPWRSFTAAAEGKNRKK